MPPPNGIGLHEERLLALRESLVTALGVYTARVLLDRALWQTAQRHPDLALLHHDEAGLSFGALEQSYATRPPEEVEEEIEAAFTDLSAEMRLILARLLGPKMAQRTCADHADSRQAGAGLA